MNMKTETPSQTTQTNTESKQMIIDYMSVKEKCAPRKGLTIRAKQRIRIAAIGVAVMAVWIGAMAIVLSIK